MFRNRSGRPRSEISSTGLTTSAAAATYSDRRASGSFPRSRATRLNTDDAPARPPVKKYHGISGCQTGSLITGRP